MILFRDTYLSLDKELCNSLQSIWSIGWTKSIIISSRIGLSYPYKTKYLNLYYFTIILFFLRVFTLSELKLKRIIKVKIQSLINSNSYKGARHKNYLPVNGQRTRTNAGTIKQLRKYDSKKLWM